MHSALKEAKEVYAPVDSCYDGKTLTVTNRYDFIPSDGIVCEYSVERNGKEISRGEIDIGGIDARRSKTYFLPVSAFADDYTAVTFLFVKNGFTVARRQTVLSDSYPCPFERNDGSRTVKITKNADGTVSVTCGKFSCGISGNGMLSYIKSNIKGDGNLLRSPIELKIGRAPIDNDKHYEDRYMHQKLGDIVANAYFFARKIAVRGNVVSVSGAYVACELEWRIDTEIAYTFYDGGRISVSVSATQNDGGISDVLTRFGFEIPLSGGFENCRYFGRGDEECYEDKKLCAVVSAYEKKTEEMFVYYVKPQESGSHCDSREVELYGKHSRLSVYSEKDFSFSIAPCRTCEYPKHRYDMEKFDGCVLNVDYRMRGIGSHSCGPEIDDEYKITEKNIFFSFDMFIR